MKEVVLKRQRILTILFEREGTHEHKIDTARSILASASLFVPVSITFAGSPNTYVRRPEQRHSGPHQQAQPRSAFQGLFYGSLSGEIYLAISIPAPTAASSQTEVITTKATRAGVDFISSFLRISAASASSRHSVSTSGGIIL